MSEIKITPKIEESWKNALLSEFNSSYFAQFKEFLLSERKLHTIYPPASTIFEAFNKTPLHKVKVVILGQDPYHGPGQAHGLSFSVPQGLPLPPSLQNIFKEISDDIGLAMPKNGNLES
ncbi:MAG TPA: uracil-DNA glycosylase, partial [Marinilabiliaceae bacterium]|nr:uracil-DNA glycosylase [Marinilabiliaceae bacterium]